MAQTITVNALSSSAVCSSTGGSLFVPFSTIGIYGKGNVFTAQLSDANGVFSGTTLTIGTLTASPLIAYTGSITATIPKTLAASNNYKIRIIASTPSVTSANTQPLSIDQPPLPTIPASPTYCQGNTAQALSAKASAGGTLNWYGTNPSSTPTATAPTPSTAKAGIIAYYVSQTLNGCESNQAVIQVVVNAIPGPPTVSNKSYCQGEVATPLSAMAISGATLNWYASPVAVTPLASAPTPSTTKAGTIAYYVSQSLNGCESTRVSVLVIVSAPPSAPKVTNPSPYCQGVTAQALTATPDNSGTLKWWGTSPSGGSYSTTPTVPSTNASANYYVSQVINGCESDRAVIAVTVKPQPNAPGTSPLEFCQNSSVPTLTASFATSATPNWYGTNATGGTASTTPPTLQSSTPGQTTYYVAQTVDGCQSTRASLTVTVKSIPSAPGVNAASYCNNAQAQPLSASGTNIKWYDAADNFINGTPTPSTNNVGNQTFRATQTINGCESPKATVTITIKPIPGQPGVSNLTYCQDQKDQPAQNIQPLTANGQNLRWYNPDGNSYSGAPTPSVSQTGVFSFQVTQTIDNCESDKATLQVTVKTTPAPTVSKPLVTYCIDEKSVPLEATGEPGSTLHWIDPYGRDTTVPPTPPTLNVNVQPGGDAYYVYQISNGCSSSRSTIKVIVNAIPTLAITGSANVNLGLKTPLHLTFTSNPPFNYTITDGYSGTVTNTTDTTILVLPRGNTTYQVLGVTNSCGVGLPGNPASAVVTVNVPTITTSSLATSTLCVGSSFQVPFTTTGSFTNGNSFRAELISQSDTTKKYEISSGNTQSPVTATLSGTLASGQYYVRVKGSNPDVGVIGTNSPTVLTIRSKPSATLTGTQTIAEGTPANLTIALGGDGPWAISYADSIRSFSAVAATSPATVEVRPARTTTYQLTSISNSCGTGTVSGQAIVSVVVALGIEDHSLDPQINVYPVPTGSTLTVNIDVSLGQNPAILHLIDQSGRSVREFTTRSRQTELDLSGQPAGIYLLRIQVGDRQSVRKILKQ
ncbi:T9SS type A sorting domain-containing protein [Spirosoma sp. SC4-14]|uniref:T9SS type A sorting domain-containing protein n=1 Tax=Spirosoma sp. SC4-14 TaxID=3128900 RepID=UPI0030D28A8D